jgi:ketosteroid isomerase-like protein
MAGTDTPFAPDFQHLIETVPGLRRNRAEAISAGVDNGEPVSPVRWSTARSPVASSGDLGIAMGIIRRSQPGADGRPDIASFFTVWRRDRPDGEWRYIAE